MQKDRILLIDDEQNLTELLNTSLSRQGYEVITYNQAIKALEEFDKIKPDLMLLDIMMPKMDGITFLQKVREDKKNHGIPAIFLSARQEGKDRVFALKQGAVDYVVKPYSVFEIFERVNIHLKLRRQEKELSSFNLRLQDELGKKTRELTDAQAKLFVSGKMASIGQLSAGIAHEINNPISYVHSNYQCLQDYNNALISCIKAYREKSSKNNLSVKEPESENGFTIDEIIEDSPGLIKESIEGCLKIKQIVVDLKTFAHPGVEGTEVCDINDIIKASIKISWNEIKYKAEVIENFGDISEIECQKQELGQVFLNLLVNAAQSIESNGKIIIRSSEKNGSILVEIEDNGCGIDPDNLSRIFEPFYTTKEVGKGTGLGLVLCHAIIEKHGGSIAARSSLGEGTVFSVLLPKDGVYNET